MRVSVLARFSFEGLHYWPEAPQDRAESYLRYPHRHMFYVEASLEVSHSNRDVEFIELRRSMLSYCAARWGVRSDVRSDSCEQIAIHLIEMFKLRSCRVFEDNENGAEVTVE